MMPVPYAAAAFLPGETRYAHPLKKYIHHKFLFINKKTPQIRLRGAGKKRGMYQKKAHRAHGSGFL